jgi:ketosteroid isomerase-like protein
MKIKGFMIPVCLFLMHATFAQNPPSDPGAAASQFLNALVEEDAGTLGSLIGNDFVLLSFDGEVVDSGTLLEGVSSGYVVIESGSTYRNYVRNYHDTGIVTGIWNVKGTLQGHSFNNRLAYTLVTVRQGASWKVVSVQFTPS